MLIHFYIMSNVSPSQQIVDDSPEAENEPVAACVFIDEAWIILLNETIFFP